jgi:hypothetical protein
VLTGSDFNGVSDPVHCAQEIDFFFGPNQTGSCPVSMDTTLAIIKPHAIADRLAGVILSEISRSFEVRSLEIFNVSKVVAAEFYEVYRGVVAASEFTGMVEELTSGPCLVMELASKCVSLPPSYLTLFQLILQATYVLHELACISHRHRALMVHGVYCLSNVLRAQTPD